MTFLLRREEEERVTSYSGCGESRIFCMYYQINRTPGRVVLCAGDSMSESFNTVKLGAYGSRVTQREAQEFDPKGYAALFDFQAWIAS